MCNVPLHPSQHFRIRYPPEYNNDLEQAENPNRDPTNVGIEDKIQKMVTLEVQYRDRTTTALPKSDEGCHSKLQTDSRLETTSIKMINADIIKNKLRVSHFIM